MEENTATLDISAINQKIERESAFIDLLTMEMNKVIVGQKINKSTFSLNFLIDCANIQCRGILFHF